MSRYGIISARSIGALILREMTTRYGRTPGGYVWAVIEPVGMIIVLAFVFTLLLRAPALGDSFILFYASGFLPFYIYQTVQTAVTNALRYSKPLLMYPAVSWIDAILARFVLNLLSAIAVMVIVMLGVIEFTGVTAVLQFDKMVIATCYAAILGLGVGCFNCFMVGMIPIYDNLWGIASRAIFLASGIIFIMERLPPNVQEIVWYFPWIHISALFRSGVYPTYEPQFIELNLVLAWALFPMAFSLVLLRRYRQHILMG